MATFMSLMGQRAMVTGSNYSKRQEQIGAIISAIICLVVVSDQSLKGGGMGYQYKSGAILVGNVCRQA
jgi:hypothetical protein